MLGVGGCLSETGEDNECLLVGELMMLKITSRVLKTIEENRIVATWLDCFV